MKKIKKNLIVLGIIFVLSLPMTYIVKPLIEIYEIQTRFYSIPIVQYKNYLKLFLQRLETNNNIISYGLENYIYTFILILIVYALIKTLCYINNIRLNKRIERMIQTKK